MVKKEYGIYFSFEQKRTKPPTPLSKNSDLIMVSFAAGEKNSEIFGQDTKFATLSPEISKVVKHLCENEPTFLHGFIEAHPVLPLGGMALVVDHKNQIIEIKGFFPTIELVPIEGMQELFKNLGLAAYLEKHTLNLVQRRLEENYKRKKKEIPLFRLKSDSRSVSPERQEQLLKQKRLVGQPLLVKRHLDLLTRYILNRRHQRININSLKIGKKPAKIKKPRK